MKDGLRCPSCNCGENKVTNTYRVSWRGVVIFRRRRQCRNCGLSFFTKEIPEDDIAPDADGPETPPPSQEDDPGGNPYL